MLQKCANPSCSAPFRSLREGKLFLAESPPPESDSLFSSPSRVRRREHFWLCQACSAQYTLRFDGQHGMLTVPIGEHAIPRYLTRAATLGD